MAWVNIREARKTDAKKIFELMQQQAAEQNTDLPSHLTHEGTCGCTTSTLVLSDHLIKKRRRNVM